MRLPETPIQATPDEVRSRLEARLLNIRSVWLPSPRDLRDWESSRAPLYVRWLGPTRFEIGPRLANMWAACFSPVYRGDLIGADSGTHLEWRIGGVRLTRLVLGLWVGIVGASIASLLPGVLSGEEPAVWLGVWALVLGGSALGSLVGRYFGGRALADGVPWLIEAAGEPLVEEDW